VPVLFKKSLGTLFALLIYIGATAQPVHPGTLTAVLTNVAVTGASPAINIDNQNRKFVYVTVTGTATVQLQVAYDEDFTTAITTHSLTADGGVSYYDIYASWFSFVYDRTGGDITVAFNAFIASYLFLASFFLKLFFREITKRWLVWSTVPFVAAMLFLDSAQVDAVKFTCNDACDRDNKLIYCCGKYEIDNKETLSAHYKFIKIRDVNENPSVESLS